MTKTRHNSNRELIGQGIGNMLAAAFGIPGAGATKGTVVNINAGGKTRSQEQFMAYFY
jgi:SulP family sulfate permease